MSVRGRVIIFSPLSFSFPQSKNKKKLFFEIIHFWDHPFKIIKTEKMTDLEKQDPVETARLTTGEESNECYTKDEMMSK